MQKYASLKARRIRSVVTKNSTYANESLVKFTVASAIKNRVLRPGSLNSHEALLLALIIEVKFNRMRMHVYAVNFFHFQVNVGVDLVIIEDIAGFQEITVTI